jgi:hypothetical protein
MGLKAHPTTHPPCASPENIHTAPATSASKRKPKMKTDIRIMLDTITLIVKANGPYKEKLQIILAECDEEDRTNLGEFIAWFDAVEW